MKLTTCCDRRGKACISNEPICRPWTKHAAGMALYDFVAGRACLHMCPQPMCRKSEQNGTKTNGRTIIYRRQRVRSRSSGGRVWRLPYFRMSMRGPCRPYLHDSLRPPHCYPFMFVFARSSRADILGVVKFFAEFS